MEADTPHEHHNAGGAEDWTSPALIWGCLAATTLAAWAAIGWLAWFLLLGPA